MAAIGAVVFTGLSLNNASNQVQAAREQNQVAQQGQYTDRYTKAVEQLGQQGTERLQIRLGAIYALERLTRDSPRDQPTIIEVLSAFIRTNTPQPPRGDPCPWQGVTVDIQATLTVLGRREPTHDDDTRIDLSSSCLVFAALPVAHLRGADLSNTDLSDAFMRSTDLSDANLSGTDLSDANLRITNLRNANLRGTDLSDANLGDADLRGTDLNDANLRGIDLSGADLGKAIHNARTDVSSAKTDSRTAGKWW